MSFDSGSFMSDSAATHREQFIVHWQTLVNTALTISDPAFESVWPRIVRSMLSHATGVPYVSQINLASEPLPSVVGSYFCDDPAANSKRELLLRCLMADYLRGVLTKYGHASAATLTVIRGDIRHVANALDALRGIDFGGVFEASAAAMYRKLHSHTPVRAAVEAYLGELSLEYVKGLAESRGDAPEFPDALVEEIYPLAIQDARGKAQTDPDLAYLLAALTIRPGCGAILDPGCGDGNLLSAAYDVLRNEPMSHALALSKLKGIEADVLATKIAALRLVLKEPFALAPSDSHHIKVGDMFSQPEDFVGVGVVLMNPPFKRYEAQDDSPVPAELREHYAHQIAEIAGPVETADGQANLYNYYVEYVIKASDSGTVFGIVLDNRWYHKPSSSALRALLLRECELIAIVEYPHDTYFKAWTIATSLLIARKKAALAGHSVYFTRTNDPRRSDFTRVALALQNEATFPADWRVNSVPQSSLDSGSWKRHFSKSLVNEYRDGNWPNLGALFTDSRRGSLDKEGGGISVFEFPFERASYGPRRKVKPNRSRYQTLEDGALTPSEESTLRSAAHEIPQSYRGYAIRNSDSLSGYLLSVNDVVIDQTLEGPVQRHSALQAAYRARRRLNWATALDSALAALTAEVKVNAYVEAVKLLVGLDEAVLSRAELWTVLREPVAGELIVPRKLRIGHRVHINPFAYASAGRQVRLSSNFFSYYECIATDPASGLDRPTAVKLIFAFLMSSFGALQFELEAYNREGARCIEGHQLEQLRIFDPRWVRQQNRALIIGAADRLPYPIPTDRSPASIPELVALDHLIADEIGHRHALLQHAPLLAEVHETLADWLELRQP